MFAALKKVRRLREQVRAFLGSYFWMPCPICGEYFGGHESHGSWYLGDGSGQATCAACAEEAGRRSQQAIERERHYPVR